MGTDTYGALGGVETMASRFVPWHGLSEAKVMVEHRMVDADEAFTLGGLDWIVYAEGLDEHIDAPLADEHKVIRRSSDGAVMGMMSKKYGLIQHAWLKPVVNAIIQSRPDAHIVADGALFHGKVVWVLIQLDDQVKTFSGGNGERLYRYLLLYTSHDGSYAMTARFTNVRVECMNTFSMAIGKANQMIHVIRHTSGAEAYVGQALVAVQKAVQTFDLMDMEIEALLTAEQSKSDTYKVFQDVLGERSDEKGRSQTLWDNAFDGMVAEWQKPFNSNIQGTKWGTIMAVNGYELWGQKARGQSQAQKQMRHLLDGTYKMTERALALVAA